MHKLKQVRLGKRLTQAELSNLSGISQQYISDIEKGVSTGSVSTLRKLAKALNVSVSELLDDKSN